MNISSEGQDITRRFFEALQMLKERKVIRGVHTFTKDNGIDYRNFVAVRKEPNIRVLKPEWIFYLSKYHISPDWIITGRGGAFLM